MMIVAIAHTTSRHTTSTTTGTITATMLRPSAVIVTVGMVTDREGYYISADHVCVHYSPEEGEWYTVSCPTI